MGQRYFPGDAVSWKSRKSDVLSRAQEQIQSYLEGELPAFSLPLTLLGTAFQKLVWHQLLAIPYAETRSYGQIAQALGRPEASRAVGAAVARNPVSLIVPCHRVVGAGGKLTGYAGGLERKKKLLALEAR